MRNFDDLCADFNQNKPQRAIWGKSLLFDVSLDEWQEFETTNDVLVRYLKNNGFEYLHKAGTVWFLFHGLWKYCTYKIVDNKLCFYLVSFN